MIKRLEDLLPKEDLPLELDGGDLFEKVVGDERYKLGKTGIAASSGCVACNHGGGCNVRPYAPDEGTLDERKDYKQ